MTPLEIRKLADKIWEMAAPFEQQENRDVDIEKILKRCSSDLHYLAILRQKEAGPK